MTKLTRWICYFVCFNLSVIVNGMMAGTGGQVILIVLVVWFLGFLMFTFVGITEIIASLIKKRGT